MSDTRRAAHHVSPHGHSGQTMPSTTPLPKTQAPLVRPRSRDRRRFRTDVRSKTEGGTTVMAVDAGAGRMAVGVLEEVQAVPGESPGDTDPHSASAGSAAGSAAPAATSKSAPAAAPSYPISAKREIDAKLKQEQQQQAIKVELNQRGQGCITTAEPGADTPLDAGETKAKCISVLLNTRFSKGEQRVHIYAMAQEITCSSYEEKHPMFQQEFMASVASIREFLNANYADFTLDDYDIVRTAASAKLAENVALDVTDAAPVAPSDVPAPLQTLPTVCIAASKIATEDWYSRLTIDKKTGRHYPPQCANVNTAWSVEEIQQYALFGNSPTEYLQAEAPMPSDQPLHSSIYEFVKGWQLAASSPESHFWWPDMSLNMLMSICGAIHYLAPGFGIWIESRRPLPKDAAKRKDYYHGSTPGSTSDIARAGLIGCIGAGAASLEWCFGTAVRLVYTGSFNIAHHYPLSEATKSSAVPEDKWGVSGGQMVADDGTLPLRVVYRGLADPHAQVFHKANQNAFRDDHNNDGDRWFHITHAFVWATSPRLVMKFYKEVWQVYTKVSPEDEHSITEDWQTWEPVISDIAIARRDKKAVAYDWKHPADLTKARPISEWSICHLSPINMGTLPVALPPIADLGCPENTEVFANLVIKSNANGNMDFGDPEFFTHKRWLAMRLNNDPMYIPIGRYSPQYGSLAGVAPFFELSSPATTPMSFKASLCFAKDFWSVGAGGRDPLSCRYTLCVAEKVITPAIKQVHSMQLHADTPENRKQYRDKRAQLVTARLKAMVHVPEVAAAKSPTSAKEIPKYIAEDPDPTRRWQCKTEEGYVDYTPDVNALINTEFAKNPLGEARWYFSSKAGYLIDLKERMQYRCSAKFGNIQKQRGRDIRYYTVERTDMAESSLRPVDPPPIPVVPPPPPLVPAPPKPKPSAYTQADVRRADTNVDTKARPSRRDRGRSRARSRSPARSSRQMERITAIPPPAGGIAPPKDFDKTGPEAKKKHEVPPDPKRARNPPPLNLRENVRLRSAEPQRDPAPRSRSRRTSRRNEDKMTPEERRKTQQRRTVSRWVQYGMAATVACPADYYGCNQGGYVPLPKSVMLDENERWPLPTGESVQVKGLDKSELIARRLRKDLDREMVELAQLDIHNAKEVDKSTPAKAKVAIDGAVEPVDVDTEELMSMAAQTVVNRIGFVPTQGVIGGLGKMKSVHGVMDPNTYGSKVLLSKVGKPNVYGRWGDSPQKGVGGITDSLDAKDVSPQEAADALQKAIDTRAYVAHALVETKQRVRKKLASNLGNSSRSTSIVFDRLKEVVHDHGVPTADRPSTLPIDPTGDGPDPYVPTSEDESDEPAPWSWTKSKLGQRLVANACRVDQVVDTLQQMPALSLRLEDTSGDLNQEAARSSALRIETPISASSGLDSTILADSKAGDTSGVVAPGAVVAESGSGARDQFAVGSRAISLLSNVMRKFKKTCSDNVNNTAPVSDLADAVAWDGPMCGILAEQFVTVQALLAHYPQEFDVKEKDGVLMATALPGSEVADWWVTDGGPVPAPVRADMKDGPVPDQPDWNDQASGSPSPKFSGPKAEPKPTALLLS